MAPRSRRRNQAAKQSSRRSVRKKSHKRRIPIDWGRVLFRLLIAIFLIADVVLIVFVVRRCAEPPPIVEETQVEAPQPEKEPDKDRPVQVEVLNGCGVSGIAAKFTTYLREAGYDVIKTDNYESHNVEETLVIERRGKQENGLKVADALGLSRSRVLQEVNEVYLIDVTIILGRDFRTVGAWQDMEY